MKAVVKVRWLPVTYISPERELIDEAIEKLGRSGMWTVWMIRAKPMTDFTIKRALESGQ
jgi:hypothetical protein